MTSTKILPSPPALSFTEKRNKKLIAELRKRSFSQTRGDVLRLRIRIFLRESSALFVSFFQSSSVVVVCAEWKRTDESFGFRGGGGRAVEMISMKY